MLRIYNEIFAFRGSADKITTAKSTETAYF